MKASRDSRKRMGRSFTESPDVCGALPGQVPITCILGN